jgi:HTH-type transcriptional regulator/antitoxin HigA
MQPKILKTEADHRTALAHIDSLMSSAPGTPEADELELWVHLVEEYEEKTSPIPLPDPIEAIRFRMEQQGLKQKDLIPFIGSTSKVSEVMNGKRPLSIAMIRQLHEGLGIPAEVLISDSGRTSHIKVDGITWKAL